MCECNLLVWEEDNGALVARRADRAYLIENAADYHGIPVFAFDDDACVLIVKYDDPKELRVFRDVMPLALAKEVACSHVHSASAENWENPHFAGWPSGRW